MWDDIIGLAVIAFALFVCLCIVGLGGNLTKRFEKWLGRKK